MFPTVVIILKPTPVNYRQNGKIYDEVIHWWWNLSRIITFENSLITFLWIWRREFRMLLKSGFNLRSKLVKLVTSGEFMNVISYLLFISNTPQRKPKWNLIYLLIFFLQSKNWLLPLLILVVAVLVAIYEFRPSHFALTQTTHMIASKKPTWYFCYSPE